MTLSASRLTYLGPEGTFTHRASFAVEAARRVPLRSIRGVFEAVARGDSDAGFVPGENVVEGAVDETLDLLLAGPAVVSGEVVLAIQHCLVGRSERKITRVYSHPQALAQCGTWLHAHLPEAERVECVSTGEAAALAVGDDQSAAIGPGARAGLEVLVRGLGREGNRTRFFLISRALAPRTGQDRTLVAFGAPHRPGALQACLAPFATLGINLTRIESRPSRGEAWTYSFVVEIEGHPGDAPIAQALADLGALAVNVRVLGAWAAAGDQGSEGADNR